MHVPGMLITANLILPEGALAGTAVARQTALPVEDHP